MSLIHPEEIVPVEEAVRAVLDQEKVRVIQVLYFAFARQLWKCKKKYSGATLVLMAHSKKDQWLGRGLDDRVLRRLALDVFGITLT